MTQWPWSMLDGKRAGPPWWLRPATAAEFTELTRRREQLRMLDELWTIAREKHE